MGLAKIAAVISKFPEHELVIRRLCSQELDFRNDCEDYDAAVAALQRWESAGSRYVERANEYRNILGELEADILKDINSYLRRVIQQKDG